jgi:hypothetical protein
MAAKAKPRVRQGMEDPTPPVFSKAAEVRARKILGITEPKAAQAATNGRARKVRRAAAA